ncbi:MAG TPA: DUF3810 domain-containing protein [Ferruginibacter sp.]|jgi:hypothetical protein|nr:DUF3810 domain-containing protein [Ferruginibacter sp.]
MRLKPIDYFYTGMKLKKSLLFTLILVIIALFIHFYSGDSGRVESQYSNGIYPVLSRSLRYLFGWIPFSFGDILYGSFIIWLAWKLGRGIKAIFKRQTTWNGFLSGAGKAFRVLLLVYIIFNAFWGINYNRVGIAIQLGLQEEKYNLQDLKLVNKLLAEKTNAAKQALVNSPGKYPSNKELFSKVKAAYQHVEKQYPFLRYHPASLKPSVWSWFGNYMGFTGYYNPFTGEAQVNTLVPKFLQPFTTCHEVAHQLGYAKEMEANFVGYLAATASQDSLLLYSVYLDLFMYSNRNLYMTDSVAAKEFSKQLIPAVKSDLKEWRLFNRKHKSFVEPVIRWIYGAYLRQNQQPQGVLSYDEVTGFIIAYYKKYGRI